MNNIKIYLYLGLVLLFVGLLGKVIIQKAMLQKVERELIAAQNNYNSLVSENNHLKDSNREFTLTVDQLNYTQDSLFKEMNAMRKSLKIKDKEIERLAYLNSIGKKTDTVYFKDTVLAKNVKLDTTVAELPWYSATISLEYPSKIAVSAEWTSEKYLITHISKEPLGTPKKCFIGRWFQKKVTVVETEVIEKNPYIKNKKQRFVEVIQ